MSLNSRRNFAMKAHAFDLNASNRSSRKRLVAILLALLAVLFCSLLVGSVLLERSANDARMQRGVEHHDGLHATPLGRGNPSFVPQSGARLPNIDRDDSLPEVGDVSPRRVH